VRPVVQRTSVGPCTRSVKSRAVLSHGVGLSRDIGVAVEMAGRPPQEGVPADPRLAGLGLKPQGRRASVSVKRDRGRAVPVGARTMTEAQALGALFVVLLFVAYCVWDLSHHR